MKAFPIVALSLVLAAACGGKSKGGATPPANDTAAAAADTNDPATPFDDAAVQAALAATPGVSQCGVEDGQTMGQWFAAQREGLSSGGSGGTPLDESFKCAPRDEGGWECQWSVFTKPSAPDPEDPCAGEGGGSGYIIMVNVGADGAIVPDQINCNAPG